MRPVKELRAADRLGLVYAAPFPYLFAQDLADAQALPAEKWMVVVVPLDFDGRLPHQARISTALQRTYAPDYVAAIIYRGFHADSKAAYADLDEQMAGASVQFDGLKLSSRKTLEQAKADADALAVPTISDAELQATCTTALLAKQTIEASEVLKVG